MFALKEKWALWQDCLNEHVPNSLMRRINTCYWDYTIYQIILNGRQKRINENPEEPELNGAFHSFIDRNYFISSLVTLRGLVEGQDASLYKKRGVYSLRALLNDLKKSQEFLTREMYFELNELEYDLENVIKEFVDWRQSQPDDNNGIGILVPKEYDWDAVNSAHEMFDKLSGITAHERSKTDLIKSCVFEKLESILDEFKELFDYINKFYAHAASPESLIYYNKPETPFTISKIWQCINKVYGIVRFLSEALFSSSIHPLPLKTASYYKHWESPLFTKMELMDIKTLRKDFEIDLDKKILEYNNEIWQLIEKGT